MLKFSRAEKDEIRTAAQIASGWWADQLVSEPHHAYSSGSSDYTFLLGWLDKKPTIEPEEKRNKFRQYIYAEVVKFLMGRRKEPINFRVDYEPQGLLLEACKFAGLDLKFLNLPNKSNMWVERYEIEVSSGRRMPVEILWKSAIVPKPKSKYTSWLSESENA
jgi:hypothetical protein